PGGFGKLVAAKLQPPDETPNEDYPFILTTGRQLEHWHTGAMTRRASTLDALEPSAVASVSRGTIAKLGIKPGDPIRASTRRGLSSAVASWNWPRAKTMPFPMGSFSFRSHSSRPPPTS